MSHTLPITNIAPENGWLEDEIFFRDGPFSGAMLVLESVMIQSHKKKPQNPNNF